MVKTARKYRAIATETGAVLAEGTALTVAKVLGCTENNIYDAHRNGRKIYLRVVIEQDKEVSWSQQQAADEWEAFMQPLREKYGIPVKRMGDQNNGEE